MKRPYYILNDGRLSRKDNTIFFEKTGNKDEEPTRKPIPVETVESLYCFGQNDYNASFFNFLSEHGIILHQFNYYGFYSGSFYPREKLVAGELLVNQVKAYLDKEDRLNIAVKTIESSVFHILQNLKEHPENVTRQIQKIEQLKTLIETVKGVNELMAVEAQIRKIYYESWNYLLNWEEPFDKRTKRPPENSLNALISFGNSLLYTTTLGEIYQTQLNPTVSYLHEPGVRRYSLSLDISEIFKPFLVDKLIFRLINLKMIKIDDFDRDLNFCYLNERGRKVFLKEWDERLRTTIKHRQLNRSVSYKQLIRLELYKLVKHLLKEKEFKPLHVWW